MSVKLMLMFFVMFLGALSAHAQSPVEEVGDEKEPKLRVELLQLVRDDQNVRAEFDQYRKRHGLLGIDEKALNEKLNKNPKLKEGFQALSLRLQESEDARLFRVKQILVKYGWPGRTLVGTEGAKAAWLLVLHYDRDVTFQRRALELMKLLPKGEVENTHIAYLTDSVSLREEFNQNQVYGTVLTNENGKLVPKQLFEGVNVDKRRAELGLQPLAEYIRRQTEALLPRRPSQKIGDGPKPELRAELLQLGADDHRHHSGDGARAGAPRPGLPRPVRQRHGSTRPQHCRRDDRRGLLVDRPTRNRPTRTATPRRPGRTTVVSLVLLSGAAVGLGVWLLILGLVLIFIIAASCKEADYPRWKRVFGAAALSFDPSGK